MRFRPRKLPASPVVCCSFCGKDQHHVFFLVAGPEAHICDQCIAASQKIVTDKLRELCEKVRQ